MKDSEFTRAVDQMEVYQIQVRGILDETWSDWFDGMMITVERDVTTMTGAIPDQAALRGILDRIWDLNLALISVMRTDASFRVTS